VIRQGSSHCLESGHLVFYLLTIFNFVVWCAEQVHTACMAYDPVSCESRYLNVAAKSLLIISCGGQFPILEELPLRALRSAKQMCDVYEPMSSETAAEWAPVISLTFDTSVTQNRERAFVMYDDADLKVEHHIFSFFLVCV